jgi:DNA-directed RNA polymerase subunit RPC12/RpoP
MSVERYIKGDDGRIRLNGNQVEIRRYGLTERLNNNWLGQNYPLDAFLDLPAINRVLLITFNNGTSILRIEASSSPQRQRPGKDSQSGNSASEVTLENSIVFAPNKLLPLTCFFDELKQIFLQREICAVFEKLPSTDAVQIDYDPPLIYYKGQRGETGFVSKGADVQQLPASKSSENVPYVPQEKVLISQDEYKGSNLIENVCPHCAYRVVVAEDVPGLNCPACDQRVIIRNGKMFTIEQAKLQGA